ncbi:MAG: XRE family transcriptional regulator [Zoogloeaceae bacterium]|jgi:predicted XRE-type DNA-binding protein|nr:XRE family transcriptional regulator [Zoogloeaceae bacterium]
MKTQEFESVWDALEDTPAEAENMKIRSRMMLDLKRHIKAHNLTQEEAARLFGVTQPRISDLMRGKIARFSMDSLTSMAATAGLRVDVRILSAA